MTLTNSIVDVAGIAVGHAQNLEGLTGCTVILCEKGAIAGVDQRGGAPGTRETDLLRPSRLVQHVQAILLAGGSAFGLDAASGVMIYLDERGVGFDTRIAKVPIVPAAIIYDLGIGRPDVRPDAAMGYLACMNASRKPPAEGNVGAGAGATIGKIFGSAGAMKSGLGTASLEIRRGIFVGALVVVNAFGDVVDPQSGNIIAGARAIQKGPLRLGAGPIFADTLQVMATQVGGMALTLSQRENTVIGVVATNARFNKEEINYIALMAHDGLARTIRPAHTMLDGDTIFALSTGNRRADVNLVGSFAAEVFAQAVLRAVTQAESAGGLPSIQDLTR